MYNQASLILSILIVSTLASLQLQAADKILVGYEPGCFAKVYTTQEWPIDALPEAPAGTVRFEEMPQITMTAFDRKHEGHPNTLINHALLDFRNEMRYYAVEFEGYIQAEQDGLYTISIITDDRCEVYIEGKTLIENWPTLKDNHVIYNGGNRSEDAPSYWKYGRQQGTVKLTGGRWYHVSIISKQIYRPMYNNGNSRYFNGAHLEVFMSQGDQESQLIQLYLPIYDE